MRTQRSRAISDADASATAPSGQIQGIEQSRSTSPSPKFSCQFCPPENLRAFHKKVGLSQHQRKAHPEEYHRKSLPEMKAPATASQKITLEEIKLLARSEATYFSNHPGFRGDRAKKLRSEGFSTRSYDAVRKIRQRPDYKSMVLECTLEISAQVPVAASEPIPDPPATRRSSSAS